MRTTFTSLIMLLFRIYSFAQQPEQYFDYKWNVCSKKEASFYMSSLNTDSGFVVVDYYISNNSPQMVGKFVSANRKIKNGYFTYYHSNGKISSQGLYKYGKHEGEWVYYYSNGQKMKTAQFKNDRQIGTNLSWYRDGSLSDSMYFGSDFAYQITWFENNNIASEGKWNALGENRKGEWIFYHKNGAKSAIVKYNNLGKIISAQYLNELEEDVTEIAMTDRPVLFKDGIDDWTNYLSANLFFPKNETLKRKHKARVVISFTVDEDGNVLYPEVKVPYKEEYDKIALEIVEKSPRWQPALFQNRKIRSCLQVPITFTMD